MSSLVKTVFENTKNTHLSDLLAKDGAKISVIIITATNNNSNHVLVS